MGLDPRFRVFVKTPASGMNCIRYILLSPWNVFKERPLLLSTTIVLQLTQTELLNAYLTY